MYNTDNIDTLADALVELLGFFASPQRVEILLREAKVDLDQALFPLLVCLAMRGPLAVAGISEQVGRDHTTISRQLSKLESLGLVVRREGGDRRIRLVDLTDEGNRIARAVTRARRRLLTQALAGWSDGDLAKLAQLNRRFVDTLAAAARDRGR